MADLTLSISEDRLDILAYRYGYQAEIDDGAGVGTLVKNPVSKEEFVLSVVAGRIDADAKETERQLAIDDITTTIEAKYSAEPVAMKVGTLSVASAAKVEG